MKKGSLGRRLFFAVSSLYIVAYLIWGVWLAQKGDSTVLEFIPFLLVFAVCFFVVMYCVQVKRMLVNMFSTYNHRSATPDEFPDLDLDIKRLSLFPCFYLSSS